LPTGRLAALAATLAFHHGLLVFTCAGATLLAHNETETPGWVPVLEIRAMSSSPEGAQSNVSGPRNLVKGEPIATTITSGATLCSLGISATDMPPGPSVPNSVWKLTGEYLGEQGGRHQIRVTSGFTRLDGQASSATTTQTLSLREGDELTLDALSAPVSGRCQVHTVTINARLVLQPSDPALARARYTADLWLVHTDPNGQQQRERLITNLDGSSSAPFNFSRLGFPVPLLDARQGNVEGFIQLTGTLRGRTRADGLVDVDVDTNRIIFGAERTDRPSSFTVPRTRKTLTLKPEETTAIDFPPPGSGVVSLALNEGTGSGGGIGIGARVAGQRAATADGVPVQVSGDRLVVNTGAFFKGHRTQMLVTLRRVR
jgi:hypothetical protein